MAPVEVVVGVDRRPGLLVGGQPRVEQPLVGAGELCRWAPSRSSAVSAANFRSGRNSDGVVQVAQQHGGRVGGDPGHRHAGPEERPGRSPSGPRDLGPWECRRGLSWRNARTAALRRARRSCAARRARRGTMVACPRSRSVPCPPSTTSSGANSWPAGPTFQRRRRRRFRAPGHRGRRRARARPPAGGRPLGPRRAGGADRRRRHGGLGRARGLAQPAAQALGDGPAGAGAPGAAGPGAGPGTHERRPRHRRERGWEFLYLTARGGTGVDAFYRGLGYRELGRLPGAIRVAPGDDREEILLHLPL